MNNNEFTLVGKYKQTITKIVDVIFTIAMAVFIAVSHGEQNLIGTHIFKFFACIFIAFGLLLYTIKNSSKKELLYDVLFKVITLTSISIILALTIEKIDFSGLYSVFYLMYIFILYSLLNKKSFWVINGEKKLLTSKEFLQIRFNKTISWIPTLLMFVAILIPGIFNFPTIGYIISLVVGYIIELVIVYLAFKLSPHSPSNNKFSQN